MKGTCIYCGKGVLALDTAAYRITGWEVERVQGGANRIAERERVAGVVAHASCVASHQRQVKLGIADAQESLL